MVHFVLNHSLPIGDVCPFDNLNLKFSDEEYKIGRKRDTVTLTPIFDISKPAHIGKYFFIQKVDLIKENGKLKIELIPNNLYVVISYFLVMIMGYREALNDPALSSGDVLIATFIMFSVFLVTNLLLLKKAILKEVSRTFGRMPSC